MKIFVLIFFISTSAFAGRRVEVPLMESSVQQHVYSPGSVNWNEFFGRHGVVVFLKNLSNRVQTVTVTIYGENISNSLNIGNQKSISSPPWNKSGNWLNASVTLSRPASGTGAYILTKTIAANSSETFIFQAFCKWNTNGPNCNNFVSPTGWTSNFVMSDLHELVKLVPAAGGTFQPEPRVNPDNSIHGMATSHTFSLSITVAEDRGALIGTVKAASSISSATLQENTKDMSYINGGDPF